MANDNPLLISTSVYRGLLTPEQLAEGMTAANHNAARLLEGAELLAERAHWSSAAALAVFAIEETAKEEILRALATRPGDATKFWRAFTSHRDKGDLAAVAWAREDASVMELLVVTLASGLGVVGRGVEAVKWRALYVDCLATDAGPLWWTPERMRAADALAMLETARRVVRRRVVSAEEVHILIRHMAPVVGAPWDDVNRAQARYLREVVDQGLREKEPWMSTRLGFDPWAESSRE